MSLSGSHLMVDRCSSYGLVKVYRILLSTRILNRGAVTKEVAGHVHIFGEPLL
jgi:hypothetical protein